MKNVLKVMVFALLMMCLCLVAMDCASAKDKVGDPDYDVTFEAVELKDGVLYTSQFCWLMARKVPKGTVLILEAIRDGKAKVRYNNQSYWVPKGQYKRTWLDRLKNYKRTAKSAKTIRTKNGEKILTIPKGKQYLECYDVNGKKMAYYRGAAGY